MADFKAKNKVILDLADGSKIPYGEVGGEVKVAYDEYICTQNVYAIGDKIMTSIKLPAGARVLYAKVCSESLGTAGIMDFGTEADQDALVVSADAGGQAVAKDGAGVDINKKLAVATEYQLEFTEASDAALGKKISASVLYTLV